ncbi:MAG: Gldg family protein [Eubacteriales bacterium]|jgi:ABC-2 type transport system permease protein
MRRFRITGKKLKYGTLTVIFTAMFIAAAVILNVFVSYATDRFGLRIDLTDERIYEISDETKRFLQNDLQEDIQITILSSESVYIDNASFSPIREVILRYIALSDGKISIRYIDPYVNPEIVDQYSDLGTPNYRDIVVESGKRYKVLNPADLYAIRTNYETQEQYITGLQAEQKLSSAIMYCVIDELPVALRVQGHSETNLPQLNSLLVSGNYKVDTINLSIDDIPDECSMLIIAAPRTDFTAEEIEKLDAYFERNGNAIVLYDLNVPTLPVFERFMEDWGIKYEQVLVGDEKQSISVPTTLAPSMINHSMTEDLGRSGEYVIAPISRQITTLYDTQGWRTVYPILVTSSASYGKMYSSEKTLTSTAREEGDLEGPFYVSVLTEQNKIVNLQNNYSRILFAQLNMAADEMLEVDAFLNQRFFVRAINYMNESADAIVVEPRYYTSSQLNILGDQASVVFWFLVVIIPLGTLTCGFYIWARRRNM